MNKYISNLLFYLTVLLLQPDIVSKLVKVPGIIVSASGIRSKATKIAIQCRSCKVTQVNIPIKPGLEGYTLPRKCST